MQIGTRETRRHARPRRPRADGTRLAAVTATIVTTLAFGGGAVALHRTFGEPGVLVPTAAQLLGAAPKTTPAPLPTADLPPEVLPRDVLPGAAAVPGDPGRRPESVARSRDRDSAGLPATSDTGVLPPATSDTGVLPPAAADAVAAITGGLTTATPWLWPYGPVVSAGMPVATSAPTPKPPAATTPTSSAPVTTVPNASDPAMSAPSSPAPATSAGPSATTAPPTTNSPAPAPTAPAATTAPPTRTGFPDASNTGVPPGTALSRYTGPCTITAANTVIDAKTIDCDLLIKTSGVVVSRSKLNGTIDIEGSGLSLTVTDTEIDGGKATRAAIGYNDITVLRSNIYGAQHGVNCAGNCTIKDSWIHDQYVAPDGAAHLQPFISNGARNVTLVHNSLSCTAQDTSAGGGCTANISIFGDFSGNSNFLIDNNYLIASSSVGFCAYGGTDPKKEYGTEVSGIQYVNNVFQRGSNGKCGYAGPITSFDTGAPGNVWRNNIFDDGTPVNP